MFSDATLVDHFESIVFRVYGRAEGTALSSLVKKKKKKSPQLGSSEGSFTSDAVAFSSFLNPPPPFVSAFSHFS